MEDCRREVGQGLLEYGLVIIILAVLIIVLLFIQWKYAYKVCTFNLMLHDILILSECNRVFKVF